MTEQVHGDLLASVPGHIANRTRAVLAANREAILTYWAIGRDILDRQELQGRGAKVIDRLAADLRERHPGSRGSRPRNLHYMRAFAAAWPEATIVQRSVAQMPWRHHQLLLDRFCCSSTTSSTGSW